MKAISWLFSPLLTGSDKGPCSSLVTLERMPGSRSAVAVGIDVRNGSAKGLSDFPVQPDSVLLDGSFQVPLASVLENHFPFHLVPNNSEADGSSSRTKEGPGHKGLILLLGQNLFFRLDVLWIDFRAIVLSFIVGGSKVRI